VTMDQVKRVAKRMLDGGMLVAMVGRPSAATAAGGNTAGPSADPAAAPAARPVDKK